MTTPIPLLEPVVLNDVIQEFRPAPDLQLLNIVPKQQIPTSVYYWDILDNANTMAQFNVPNAEAQLVDKPGRRQGKASLAYTREKKTFQPTTTMWIRQAGTTSQVQNAEQAILNELRDLNNRVDILQEYTMWKALQGSIHISNIGAGPVDVDFGYTSNNFDHPTVGWDTATPVQIADDLTRWFQKQRRANGIAATDAWLSMPTLNRIYHSFADNAEGGGFLMSDVMKQAYFSSSLRQLPGFMGINWHVVEGSYDLSYDPDANDPQQFLEDDMIIFTNLNAGNPVSLVEGPAADFGAGAGYTGRYIKTWEQEDPSARFALLETRWLPVVRRTSNFLVIPSVIETS